MRNELIPMATVPPTLPVLKITIGFTGNSTTLNTSEYSISLPLDTRTSRKRRTQLVGQSDAQTRKGCLSVRNGSYLRIGNEQGNDNGTYLRQYENPESSYNTSR